jgi:hypothetical protein
MLTFTVHESPDPPTDRIDRAERLAFVRDGFSWSAALFTPIWLLVHRLWWPFVGYLGLETLIALLGHRALVHSGWITLAGLALGLIFGLEADTLRRWQLARRGWTTLGAVSGRNADDCERRFFDMWLPSQPILAHPASVSEATSSGAGAAGGGDAGSGRSLLGALSGARS